VSGRALQIGRGGSVRPPTEAEAAGILHGALRTMSAFRRVLAGEQAGRQVIVIGERHEQIGA